MKATQASGQAVISSLNVLINITTRILQNSTDNSIPISQIIALQENLAIYAVDLATLSSTLDQARSPAAYLASIVASLTTDVITLTTQIQQLQFAGAAFNAQFIKGTQGTLTSLQGLTTAFAGTSNAAEFASAVGKFNDAAPALHQPPIPIVSASAAM